MADRLLDTAIHAARAAGDILIDMFGKFGEVQYKGARDLVTEADKKAESMIISVIRKDFPQHSILTEESKGYQADKNNDFVWIIDPLDGTTNYCHSLPFFGVSIACRKENETILGVVYCPMNDELFTARLGQGAFLNRNQLSIKGSLTLRQSILATGFPYNINDNPLYNFDNLILLEKRVQAIRRLGSAAINLAYVACSRFDSYWESMLYPWDVAAGALLVTEAGGSISDLYGGPFDPLKGEILASNPSIQSEIVDILKLESEEKWCLIKALGNEDIENEVH